MKEPWDEEVTEFVEESDCILLLGAFMTDINLGIYTAKLDVKIAFTLPRTVADLLSPLPQYAARRLHQATDR